MIHERRSSPPFSKCLRCSPIQTDIGDRLFFCACERQRNFNQTGLSFFVHRFREKMLRSWTSHRTRLVTCGNHSETIKVWSGVQRAIGQRPFEFRCSCAINDLYHEGTTDVQSYDYLIIPSKIERDTGHSVDVSVIDPSREARKK